ncbi:TadE/TadG family type IV pilus assembly protein [Paraburkholderia kururiensis]|uniref:TadE/TadG family type IV pilus assembly protein n=1 Tax=Paraburkholderia kururiensis TaxID=984307 RepID=UPI0005AB81E1|nr:TadE/TadG family type IV pilus assembly protein [Paraburkholderia kururiensis]
MRPVLRRAGGFVQGLLHDTRGVAALEFVFILPLMTGVLFGIYEIGQYARVNMQLANAATSMADLVAQQAAGVSGGTTGSLGNFCAAGRLMMNPFPASATSGAGSFSAAIASVTNYTATGVTVDWESDRACTVTATALGATAKTLVASPTNLVPNAGTPGDSVIVVQVTYQYSSPIQYLIPSAFTLTQTAFARPRITGTIACAAPCS